MGLLCDFLFLADSAETADMQVVNIELLRKKSFKFIQIFQICFVQIRYISVKR